MGRHDTQHNSTSANDTQSKNIQILDWTLSYTQNETGHWDWVILEQIEESLLLASH